MAAQVNRLSREAEAAYTEALRLEPGRVPVMLRLSRPRRREAKKARAGRKALAANPDLGAARRGLCAVRRPSANSGRRWRRFKVTKRSDRSDHAKYLLAQIMNDAGRPSAG